MMKRVGPSPLSHSHCNASPQLRSSQVERHEQTGVQISLEGDRSRLNITRSHSHTPRQQSDWLLLHFHCLIFNEQETWKCPFDITHTWKMKIKSTSQVESLQAFATSVLRKKKKSSEFLFRNVSLTDCIFVLGAGRFFFIISSQGIGYKKLKKKRSRQEK